MWPRYRPNLCVSEIWEDWENKGHCWFAAVALKLRLCWNAQVKQNLYALVLLYKQTSSKNVLFIFIILGFFLSSRLWCCSHRVCDCSTRSLVEVFLISLASCLFQIVLREPGPVIQKEPQGRNRHPRRGAGCCCHPYRARSPSLWIQSLVPWKLLKQGACGHQGA